MKKKMAGIFSLAVIAVVLVALPVYAASSSGPLADVYTTLTDWAQRTVGQTISLGIILVGIVAGIANQSLIAFAVGTGRGLGLGRSGRGGHRQRGWCWQNRQWHRRQHALQ